MGPMDLNASVAVIVAVIVIAGLLPFLMARIEQALNQDQHVKRR